MKVDRKKFLIGTGVVVLAVAAFCIANPNNGTHSQNARAKELAKELDETVTEDSIQGTYVTDDGKIFAIDINDTDILGVNLLLPKGIRGTTDGTCSAVFPDQGWLEEYAYIDLAENSICLLDDKETKYTYEMDKKNLTLTNPENEKFECRKISDEYNADKVIDSSLLKPEDIAGVYKDGDLAIEIDKNNKESLDVYWLEFKDSEYEITAMATNVPIETIIEKGAIALVGEDAYDARCAYFITRRRIAFESYKAGLKVADLTEDDYDVSKKKEQVLKNHQDIDYDYTSILKKIDIVNDGTDIYVFNPYWSETNKHFNYFESAYLDLEYQNDGTVQIFLNGKKYTSFKATEYEPGTDIFSVIYTCENGNRFHYYPQYEEDQLTYGEVSYLPEIQFYESLYDESDQDCGGKFVCQNNEVKKTNEESEDSYAESSEESGQEDIDLVEDEDTSIESDSDVWFITYNSFYRTRDIGGIEINVMNDAVMFVQCTGSDGTVAEWEMNLKPAEIGDDGEYIYYYGKGIKMSYYPSDHHIHVDGENNFFGDYYPNE